ncbi:RusA family crossover junction endodeoxyribonuclease [Erwinia persicina]|uniref:RusA family crossover junction endodeoxyribonuclease n=1 Tax=Erwinia persicina TaxID=55211 RepID=UPI0016544F23|nr:RusA family crossover junction endodeoxyribonuclease [Erwinia persicina]MBC3945806.1 RusA family crossover junction endodeoxyribonuclease [Erwinia persicina]
MKLTMPFPPSVNGYWRSTSRGTLISERGRKYRVNAIAAVYEQLRRRPQAITHEIDIHVILYPPTRAKRDLDNFQKALFDGLTHAGVWADDSLIKRMVVEWGSVTCHGKVEVTINEFHR